MLLAHHNLFEIGYSHGDLVDVALWSKRDWADYLFLERSPWEKHEGRTE